MIMSMNGVCRVFLLSVVTLHFIVLFMEKQFRRWVPLRCLKMNFGSLSIVSDYHQCNSILYLLLFILLIAAKIHCNFIFKIFRAQQRLSVSPALGAEQILSTLLVLSHFWQCNIKNDYILLKSSTA